MERQQKRHVKKVTRENRALVKQFMIQELVCDVMHAAGPLSISSWLELTAINHVANLSKDMLNVVLQQHINLLRSRVLRPRRCWLILITL